MLGPRGGCNSFTIRTFHKIIKFCFMILGVHAKDFMLLNFEFC